jgi:hypothetical protein
MPTQYAVSGNAISGDPTQPLPASGGLMLGSLGCCCGPSGATCDVVTCLCCDIPTGDDLQVSYQGVPVNVDGSTVSGLAPMPFFGLIGSTNVWVTNCITGGTLYNFDIEMDVDTNPPYSKYFYIVYFDRRNTECASPLLILQSANCNSEDISGGLVLQDFSCSPLKIDVVGGGFARLPAFTITDPNAKTGNCQVCFKVTTGFATGIPGATVTISGGSGASGDASGKTNVCGGLSLFILTAGTYTVTVSAFGYTTKTLTLNLQCGFSFTIVMS